MQKEVFEHGLNFNRRKFLSQLSLGIGSVALGSLLIPDLFSGNPEDAIMSGLPHFAPKAKRVIYLFQNGAPSQLDLFDYKPALFQRAGETFNPGAGQRIEAPTSEPGKILKPPFEFRQYGESGRWVSSVLPQLAQCVDQMAI